jgi:hypothetical protein
MTDYQSNCVVLFYLWKCKCIVYFVLVYHKSYRIQLLQKWVFIGISWNIEPSVFTYSYINTQITSVIVTHLEV